MSRPTVGRIVHYVSHGTPPNGRGQQVYESQCRAAIVTDVPQYLPAAAEPLDGAPNGTDGLWCVALAVLSPQGAHFDQDVPNDPAVRPGSWHWPEREG